MPELALTQHFQRSLLKLSPTHQKHVHEAVLKFQQGLSAVRLHKLKGLPFKSFGVNRDALRIICQQEADLLILLHVGNHDPAYEWAARHRVVQVGKVVRILASEQVEDEVRAVAEEHPPGPLAVLPPEAFGRLGVGPRAAEVWRRVPDEDSVVEMAEGCRPALGEALIELALEPERWEEIAADSGEETALGDAIRDPANAGAFFVAPAGEQAWLSALQAGEDVWRTFLHPSQRRLVRRRAPGAIQVTGGPGTGKTVVALHRARFLVEQVFADDERPVLLTAFSRALTDQLADGVRMLTEDAPALRDRIEVRTLVAVARLLLDAAGQPSALLTEGDIDAAWSEALAKEALGKQRAFYEGEREHVLARHDVWTRKGYQRAARDDRGEAMDRKARMKAWPVLESFEAALAARGGGDRHALARAALAVAGQPYCAVVCDEVQDVTATELRLLAALSAGDDGIRPDALFLCGDGYQRIYGAPVRLSTCGIDAGRRIARLRLNYRTTEGIRRAAVETIEQLDADRLDQAPLDGYRSLVAGAPPVRRSFESADAEADWIAEQIVDSSLDERTLVLARTRAVLDDLHGRLVARGLEPTRLGVEDSAGDGVVMCTLHRAKGLEARRVFIAGAQRIPQKWHGKGDAVDRALWERREACLLYVGITRARESCAITRVD